MQGSLEQFLEQLARRGSWVGGGSVAALSAALAAALLEKLAAHPRAVGRLRRLRRECVRLIQQDATMFARVIAATRAGNRRAFASSLKRSTEVPYRVFAHAKTIQATCRAEQRSINPQFQSDLHCVMALAAAAGESARTLIDTNLAWLKDRAYAARMRRRLRAAMQPHVS